MPQFESAELIEGDAEVELDRITDGSCRLVITSPPYNIGKEYERDQRLSLEQYLEWLEPIVAKAAAKVTEDGHLCWQVGNHVSSGQVFPLDYYFYKMICDLGFKLRNRIIWHFSFGLHAQKRFSGRYETLLWFTKSDNYHFNLDPVRIPQLYPGKRHSQGRADKAGLPSGNPKGKNPSDFWTFDAAQIFEEEPVWEIPNVKAAHPEKTIHPCQFPSELVERCILAFTCAGDSILDPFVGAGTSVLAAEKHERVGIGIDRSSDYIGLARTRLDDLRAGRLQTRPLGKPVRRPEGAERVAQVPVEWQTAAE